MAVGVSPIAVAAVTATVSPPSTSADVPAGAEPGDAANYGGSRRCHCRGSREITLIRTGGSSQRCYALRQRFSEGHIVSKPL